MTELSFKAFMAMELCGWKFTIQVLADEEDPGYEVTGFVRKVEVVLCEKPWVVIKFHRPIIRFNDVEEPVIFPVKSVAIPTPDLCIYQDPATGEIVLEPRTPQFDRMFLKAPPPH